MLIDPKNRPIASARSRGRVPAIAAASLTTVWARRTKSTIAIPAVRREDQWKEAQDDRRAAPVFGNARRGLYLLCPRTETGKQPQPGVASAGGCSLLLRDSNAREQPLLDQAEDDVSGGHVDLLNERRRFAGCEQAQIAQRGHFAAALAGEAHRDHPDLAGRGDRPQNVWRAPRGRDRDQHVTLMPEGAHLAFEHALIAIIVGDSGKRRRVGGQRDRR